MPTPEPPARYLPLLTDAGLKPSYSVVAVDEYGEPHEGHVAGEQPLAIYIDKREVVTLMTLGTHPELLVLGYLCGQRLVPCLESIHSIQVNWESDLFVEDVGRHNAAELYVIATALSERDAASRIALDQADIAPAPAPRRRRTVCASRVYLVEETR